MECRPLLRFQHRVEMKKKKKKKTSSIHNTEGRDCYGWRMNRHLFHFELGAKRHKLQFSDGFAACVCRSSRTAAPPPESVATKGQATNLEFIILFNAIRLCFYILFLFSGEGEACVWTHPERCLLAAPEWGDRPTTWCMTSNLGGCIGGGIRGVHKCRDFFVSEDWCRTFVSSCICVVNTMCFQVQYARWTASASAHAHRTYIRVAADNEHLPQGS